MMEVADGAGVTSSAVGGVVEEEAARDRSGRRSGARPFLTKE
jgi:hypothetical protein